MKTWIRFAAAAAVGFASIAAHAADAAIGAAHLTSQDCSHYPFVHVQSPSHDQLEHELALLEHEGYDPGGEDNDYPADIEAAEAKLQKDYVSVCGHAPSVQPSM